jgi:hypothetical protein
MNSAQRIIKYFAIALAIFLAVGILTSIVSVVYGVAKGISGDNFVGSRTERRSSNNSTTEYSGTFTGINSLNIEHSIGELKIVEGDEFKVEAKNVSKHFKVRVNGRGTLIISEDKEIRFLGFRFNGFHSPNAKVTVTLPSDFVAEEVKLDTGAGNVDVEKLQTDYLYISSGAGNIKGDTLSAKEAKIEGGVGSVNLENVNLTNADINCGVGNLKIGGVLTGETEIKCGIGEVELKLKGNVNDYGLDIDSGVGTISLNGEKITDSYKANEDAANILKIDGGLGTVKINLE